MYSIDEYAAMFADPVRGAVYLAAIRDTVRAGCVVADIGAGPGVLGVYAAMLGARRVFLVEPDPIVEAAIALARENGVLDRIEIIRGLSTEITLPERAHVIVSDLRGVLPLFGDHLRAAADMRQRHLAPGGICAPLRDVLFCALVEDEEMHARSVGGWSRLPDAMHHESLTELVTNRWYRTRATAGQMLTNAAAWLSIDYAQPAPSLDGQWSAVALRDGIAHGMLVWFDTEVTQGNGLSNAPGAPRALYGQAFFPFREPFRLLAGDAVSGRHRAVNAGEEHAWTWSAEVRRDGQLIASASHSTLRGTVLPASALRRRNASFVPHRAPEADVLRMLLDAVDGQHDLAALAALLHDGHPGRFPTLHDALNYVAGLEHLWLE